MTKAKQSGVVGNKKLGQSDAMQQTNYSLTPTEDICYAIWLKSGESDCYSESGELPDPQCSVECSRPASLSWPDGSQSLVSRGAGRQPVNSPNLDGVMATGDKESLYHLSKL